MSYVPFERFLLSSLIAAWLVLGVAEPSAAQSSALTLDEALRLAAERSRQLPAHVAAARAARELAVAASEPPDPTLNVGINNLPVNGPDEFSLTRDSMTMRSIGLARELVRNDKREARAARFTREAEAAEAARTVALTELRRGTATAWLNRYYQERMRDVLIRQRDDAALQVEAALLSFRSGIGMQTDVLAARSAAAQIEDRIAENARDIEIATAQLARWIGDSAVSPLGAPPSTATVPLHAADLEGELAHHPEIALMIRQEEVAQADADIARTGKRSDWTVELMYGRRGPSFSNMMSLNVYKPLQWRERSRQDRELAAKLAVAEQMRAEREDETRVHVAEARMLLAAWHADMARLDRYVSTLIPVASERSAAAMAAYRGGRGSLSTVIDSRLAEIETERERLLLEKETAELWAELTYLLPDGTAHQVSQD